MAQASTADAAEDEPAEDDQDEELGPDLEELETALKAAVISGNMTQEEGWAIWHTAVAEAKGEDGNEDDWKPGEDSDEEYDDTNGRHRIGRLVPPDPAEPSMLLEPEFLPRDVQLLSNWLDLDKQRTIIVEMIIQDYGNSFEAVTAGLAPAIRRYKQAEAVRERLQMLEHLENDVLQREVDMDSAAKAIEQRIRGYAEKDVAELAAENGKEGVDITHEVDAKIAKWTKGLTEALENIDEQMTQLRDRMKARVQSVQSPEGEVTSRDLVEMAEAIKWQRENLRQDVIEMLTLALVVDDAEAQARLDDAVSRLQVEHGFRHARMGGEFINLWSLARDADPEGITGSAADQLLVQHQAMLAGLVQDRSDATVHREIEAFRLMVVHDDLVAVAGDEDNVPLETWYEVLEPFTESWHAQIDASVTYRDSILDLVDETRQTLAQTSPRVANQYHDEAMLRGFGSEMRSRWSERAIRAVLAWEELDEETRVVVLSLQENTAQQLREIRAKAIEKRLQRDPELARQPILSLWSLDDSQGKPWIREDWTGHEMESHQRINREVDSSLEALLTSAQYEQIPSRRQKTARTPSKGGKGT